MVAICNFHRAGFFAVNLFVQHALALDTMEDDPVCPQRQSGEILLQTTWANRPDRTILADVGAAADVHRDKAHRVKPAGWFGAFSEHESTYSKDADGISDENPDRAAMFRPNIDRGPSILSDGTDNGLPDFWFHESPSGGPKAAWQTHFPSLSDLPSGTWSDMSSDMGGRLPWIRKPSGRWQQVYKPPLATFAKTRSMAKDPSWFDTSIEGYDAFGRNHEPRDVSGRRYLNWKLVGPKTCTLECKKPGCPASCKVDVYKPPVDEAKCWMSFGVHPTDFDDDACLETVEWVNVNNETVTTHCDPQTRGCMPPAATNQSVIFPCIRWLDVTKELERGKGSLNVSAKISKFVDECPLANGALLSGIAAVECWILEREKTTTTTTTTTQLLNPGKCPLQCNPCGCIANCSLTLEPVTSKGHKCLLEVSIRQTDFEKPDEVVEWITVNQKIIKTQCKPGKNQCLEKKLASTAFVHDAFPCVTNFDVTNLTSENWTTVNVSAKISEMVDECPSNGYLLDGFAEVICDGNKPKDDEADAVPPSSLLNATNSPWSWTSSEKSPAQTNLVGPSSNEALVGPSNSTAPTVAQAPTTPPAKGKGKVKAPAKGQGKVKAKVPPGVGGEPR